MRAYAIHTEGMNLITPHTFKAPNENQLKGTELEQLLEVACRICYDSMGASKSRDSKSLHYHLQDAPNLSVYAHAHITLIFETRKPEDYAVALMNRKGVYCQPEDNGIAITANLRAILEWDKWTDQLPFWSNLVLGRGEIIKNAFLDIFKERMPTALDRVEALKGYIYETVREQDLNDFQRHISVYLYGSRGFTHEQVRHFGDISQRSTRFVDELPPMPSKMEFMEPARCEGEYVWHPLILEYLADESVGEFQKETVRSQLIRSRETDRLTYKLVVNMLQDYTKTKGMSELDARKQGRGAARGSLGNALASEMIYTTSVHHWKWIFSQRGGSLADAEIREVVCDLLESFKIIPEISCYFTGYEVRAKDGKRYIHCP